MINKSEITAKGIIEWLGKELGFDPKGKVIDDLQIVIKEYKAIQRIRELHKPYQWDMLLPNSLLCTECSKISERGVNMFSIKYPCSTIKELNGEQ